MNLQKNELFGEIYKTEQLSKPSKLPLFIKSNRKFYSFNNNEHKFILIKIPNNEKFGVAAYKKQLNILIDYYNLPVSFWFDDFNLSQRKALIENNIPFVSEKQIYLPFLGILFSEKFTKSKNIYSDKMMPATQVLFLYLVYKKKNTKTNKKEAAEYLHLTQTSLTRASNQLLDMDLIKQEKKGKDVFMWIDKVDYEYFLKAKPFLINPIQEILFVESNNTIKELPLAGESALANNSMLAEPNVISFAQYRKNKKDIKSVDEKWSDNKGFFRLEIWKYDPILFMKNGCVDPISLYLSFENNNDERIENELNQMMENYKW